MYEPKWKKLTVHYKNFERYLENERLLWFHWIFVDCKESVVFYSFCIASFLFCYRNVVLSALRWKKLACVLYDVMMFEFKKMKVALTCIECLLAFMEYFASYSWVDNLMNWIRLVFLESVALYFLIENFKGNDSYIAAILVYFH